MAKLEKKVALVTGASSGVGRGIALGLADDGWDVAVNYNSNTEGADETAQAIRDQGQKAWVLQANVVVGAEVRAMFAEVQAQAGQLDLLVNNAGVQTWAPLLELKEEDW